MAIQMMFRLSPSPPEEALPSQGGSLPTPPALADSLVPFDPTVRRLKGVAAVPGGAVGPVHIHIRQRLEVPERKVEEKDISSELERFEAAVAQAGAALQILSQQAKAQDFGKDGNTIRFQSEMLRELSPAIRRSISQGINPEAAADQVFSLWIKNFEGMASEDFRVKANDIRDVRGRILRVLMGFPQPASPFSSEHPVILVAETLEPSEAFALSPDKILAVCTDGGGARDHTAVICRHRGIPVVAGLTDISKNVSPGQEVAVNAFDGVVIINPDSEVKAELLAAMKQNEIRSVTKALSKEGARTLDGTRVMLVANVESLHDVTRVCKTPLQGVGLFRSEFLFLDRDLPPTEDEQFATFFAAAQAMGKRPLTIRTMDFGDDKWPRWDTMRQKIGPNLAYSPKGIRLSLASEENEAIFRTHCRAILRASTLPNVRVMFPSINDAEEFQKALAIFYREMQDLVRMGTPLNQKIPVGTMIETPSAVSSVVHLAQVANFFSIGTNDLTQSFLGIGRRSSLIGHGFDEAHPVIIKAIRDTCTVAKERGIPVSVCGDSASDSLLAPLLLGAGVRIFSVSGSNAAQVNHMLSLCNVFECEHLVARIVDEAAGVARSRALLSDYLGILRKRAGLET